MTELSLTAAFLLGLLGAGHCVGMCGGIMAALSLHRPDENRWSLHNLSIIFGYNLGRITSYAIIGLLMGLLGWFIGGFSRETSIALRIFAGIMLIAMGLYIGGWWMGLTRLEKMGHGIWSKIQPKASSMLPIHNPGKAIMAGLIWGWLPCGLVYSTLVWAAASSDALQSATLMFAFGVGTVPIMFATGLLAQQMQALFQSKVFRSGAAILVILFGIWTIPGPHQMWVMKTFDFGGSHQMQHGNSKTNHDAGTMQHQNDQMPMQHSN
ncbi:sulfite exporter TauE/SafE family protein [Sansalvadorimonas sp. 2012CJ34-2]|uniref:Sulfite exporter TauE/SafE family protein n=1 Tax=Parendozoicomonas callyspongiae TaxID=2942213 RepID=A0ABT0PI09_9GAMM|nr:sulfite exporter TauE/SafE family protein [Sansalvadorimonas sp. 2012CJ34-2]MCL6271008.1 sulfite exporter TauE/SafE family protein [Sansalvadorimonas sp. 2012CJ34-2]